MSKSELTRGERLILINTHFDNLRGAWVIYMSWYTVFLTVNLIALSFVFSKDVMMLKEEAILLGVRYKVAISLVWALFNALGIATSIIMSIYSWKTDSLLKSIIMDDSALKLPLITRVGVMAGAFNAVALLAFFIIWISLAAAPLSSAS